MLETIAKRLKCCRAATSTTPHDVIDYVHSKGESISYATYTRWESGNTIPVRKSHVFDIIADYFVECGLQVDSKWILSGEGYPPEFAEYRAMDDDTHFLRFSRRIDNVELVQVGGAYGEPHVKFGEFIIISNENSIPKNDGKLCQVKTKEFISIGIIKVIDDSFIDITNRDKLRVRKDDIQECRKIKWIQKK